MAQASLLHRQENFNNPSFFGRSLQQAHLQQPTNLSGTTTPAHPFNYVQHTQPMAQPYLQQYRPEMSFPRSEQWPPRSPAAQQPYQSANPGQSPNDAAFPQNGPWEGGSIFDHGFVLDNNLDMTPHITPEPLNSNSSYLNTALMYPGQASLRFVNKRSAQYGEGTSWFPRRSAEVPCGVSINGSDPGIDSSYSPKSYVSETQGSQILPFKPEAGSESSDWSCYGSQIYPPIKASSPNDLASAIEDIGPVNFSGVPRHELRATVLSPTSSGVSHRFSGLPLIRNDTSSQYESEYAYSQKSSPVLSPWFPKGRSLHMAAMPYRPRDPSPSSAPINSLPTGYQAHHKNSASRGVAAWDGVRTNFPAQDPFRERVQTHRVVGTHAQRKADDETLLKGKKDGLTYKEIKKKMFTKCAESTLRGRYRSLTKARQDRVRKPIWRTKDVELLREFVQLDLDRIKTNYLHHTLSYNQRLAKVQWKKVADSIITHGGSYHFGNSTCKRKWQELNPGP